MGLLAMIIMLVEARTLFLETCVRKPLEANAFWLGKAHYRSLSYLCIVFFTSQYWALWRSEGTFAKELPVLIGGVFLLITALCLFFTRRSLAKKGIEARKKIGSY